MPGEHSAVEGILQVGWILFLMVAVGYGIYILVKFWVSFAKGINEANPKPKGFAVKVIEKERD